MRTLTKEEYLAEGRALFGDDMMAWRFVCPSCGSIATPKDWQAAGAPETAIAYSCVGRWQEGATATIFENGKGPCNYAGGGLFGLNPVTVTDGEAKHQVFEFDRPANSAAA